MPMEDSMRKPPGSPKKPGPKAKKKSQLVAFTPTKEQAQYMRDQGWTLENAIRAIEGVVNAGHKVTLGSGDAPDSYYSLVRQGGVTWDEACAVSCWAGSVERSMIVLGYFLSEVCPEFPEDAPTPWQQSFNY